MLMFQSTEGSDVEGKSGTGDSAGIKGDILTKSFTEGFYANIAKGVMPLLVLLVF